MHAMTTFLIPFLAFMAVMLIMLPGYMIWSRFMDPRNKAKKQRLVDIHNAVHWGGSPGIAQTALRDSALETWLRSRSKTFERFEGLVQHANSPLTAVLLLALMLALFMAVIVSGLLYRANPLILPLLAAAIAGTPVLWLYRQASQRRNAFEKKFPEALDYISRAMRAGHSLTSAIDMVGKEFAAPIGSEFRTVSDETAFGIPFKDAIGRLADRVNSNDLNIFVISLMIQHETGGNLTELLDGLAKTIRERIKLRGKIRTLSSEGRLSAWVLGSMPFAFAGILMLINPGYISLLWTTPRGQTLVLVGGGLMTAGIFLLSRVTQIKV